MGSTYGFKAYLNEGAIELKCPGRDVENFKRLKHFESKEFGLEVWKKGIVSFDAAKFQSSKLSESHKNVIRSSCISISIGPEKDAQRQLITPQNVKCTDLVPPQYHAL